MARRGGWVWPVVAVTVPVAASFGASQLISWALRDTTGMQGWLWAAGIAAIVIALAITAVNKFLEHRRGTSIGAAKRKQLVKLHEELIPIASTTAEMAQQPHDLRAAYLRTVAETAASALRSLVAEHVTRPRAVVYSLEEAPASMVSIAHKGRGERPRPFEAGTARGDAALEFISEKRTAFYPDLSKRTPRGYSATMSGYLTYIAVPIWTEAGVYGMVTLDAPEADSFNEGDKALVELAAEMMSIAFEVGQDREQTEPVQA